MWGGCIIFYKTSICLICGSFHVSGFPDELYNCREGRGLAWQGWAWLGSAWHGKARLGMAGRGKAWQDKTRSICLICGSFHVSGFPDELCNCREGHGAARLGGAWRGAARQGQARQDKEYLPDMWFISCIRFSR
jgi:hypothetical protein